MKPVSRVAPGHPGRVSESFANVQEARCRRLFPVTIVQRMAIDNPVEAWKAQNPEPQESPLPLVLFGMKLAVPKGALLFEVLSHVYERFTGAKAQARMREFWELLINEQKFLDANIKDIKVDLEDLKEALQVATLRDAEAFNHSKRDRYLKILGNAVRSDARIDELASFIRDVEMLGENDVTILKVLNKVMNKPGDWRNPSGRGVLDKLHPNTFIHRSKELDKEVALALGENIDRDFERNYGSLPPFDREEGYSICARLQGFGLAHEIETSAREAPIGDYCFRPSKRGFMLLKLIGEEVANWNYFFPMQKA